jgi:Ca2+-binding RTX toxin-like protein
MRRTILLLALMGLTLALCSAIALAAVKVGTDADEKIVGTDGNDQINGKGGKDDLRGKAGNDIYYFANDFGVDTLTDTAGTDT